MLNIPYLIITAIFIIGSVFLQIFLSKKQSRWPGLTLPAITFFISVLTVGGLVAYTAVDITGGNNSFIFMVVYVFALYNIPTLVLLGIYSACRNRLRRSLEIEKMSIQDLN